MEEKTEDQGFWLLSRLLYSTSAKPRADSSPRGHSIMTAASLNEYDLI